MEGLYFLGVFSGNPPKPDASVPEEPALWNVYLKKDKKNYIVQKLDQNSQTTSEQYKISPEYFGINFRKVKNSPLKKTVDRQLKMLDADKDRQNSFFASLLKNNSAFNSVFRQKKKISNEFAFQMGTGAPKQTAAEKTDTAPRIKSFEKKQTNEFQFNVSDAKAETSPKKQKDDSSFVQSQNKTLPKELQINISSKEVTEEKLQTVKNSSEKYNVNNKETDQHPFDEKYSAERFGLDSILSSLNAPEKKQTGKTEKQPAFNITNNYGLSSKQLNADTTLVHHKIKEEKSGSQTVDGNNAFFENPAGDKPYSQTDNAGNMQEQQTENGDELLPAKGNANSLSKSEKALLLDASMRREFQLSLQHWNMAKKNMALRNFRNILYKEAAFVPAHKHMFTEFAIQLRKINQHDLALASAMRCTELSPDDSHAFFNVARLYYELGRYEKANSFIDQTLRLEPDLEPALRLNGIIKECLRRKTINK